MEQELNEIKRQLFEIKKVIDKKFYNEHIYYQMERLWYTFNILYDQILDETTVEELKNKIEEYESFGDVYEIEDMVDEFESLKVDVEELKKENEELKKENEELDKMNEALSLEKKEIENALSKSQIQNV